MSSNESTAAEVKPGGQDNSEKKRFFKKQGNTGVNRTSKFEGRCEELKSHVYDYGDSKNADQFVTTTKEIKTYVGRTYKNAGDITNAITMLSLPTRTEPDDPTDPNDRVALKKWERNYDEYRKWKISLDENVKTLYNLVWGQCSESMQQKIESLPNFEDMETKNDGIALLVAIKNTSYDFQSQMYRLESINNALYKLLVLRQGQHHSPTQYFDQFTNCLAVYVYCGGSTLPDPGCMEFVAAQQGWDMKKLTEPQKAIAREMSWANLFILHADRNRYGSLITDLQNQYLSGVNKYPTTLNEALTRLSHWKDPNANGRNTNSSTNGVSFTNVGNEKGKGRNKDHITCFNCQQKGHYSNECPTKDKTETTNVTVNAETSSTALLTQGVDSGEFDDVACSLTSFALICHGNTLTHDSSSANIPSTWILLDNQSTIDVFCNKHLLADVHRSDKLMSIHCNAGVVTTSDIGTLPGYGDVWYHSTGIANILSLSRVRQNGFDVAYDNTKNCFIVKNSN
jgi:Zinc knuckle